MNKLLYGLAALAVIALGAYYLLVSPVEAPTDTAALEGATAPADGTYTIVPEESVVHWAGKRPLIEGYVDAGTVGISGGTITIADGTVTGSFTIDMTTLAVGSTPK